ncbi:uncharacterized protein LOC124275521 [Haliotis rubra]|uniref:uncharacterized protein LOC124275521 n=1 Tax=Haliotis rubra TaxID=36100 RepID=UPI001EE51295|nr:uncharacterized protein LOC124275521 [Haliotis rubra]
MRVPTHLLQPLSVDTSTSYDLDLSRFPGLDDPQYKNEPMLMVARRETNYFGYNNTPWTCSSTRESAFSSSQTMQQPDTSSASRCPPIHSSVHPVHNMGVPEDLLEIIDLQNKDLLELLDTKQYEILVDDLSQELNRQDPLPDIQILAVEQRRDTRDERLLYTNYHRPDLHATPFEQRRLSCYQTEIPQQHLRNNMPYSKTSNMCKDFKGYMYPMYSLTSNRCVAVNAPVNSFGNTLVNPVGDKSVAAAVRNKRKWSSDSDNSHKRRCLQPRHVDYLGQYSVIRQGSQIGVM